MIVFLFVRWVNMLKYDDGLLKVVWWRVRNWLMYYFLMWVVLVFMKIEKLNRLFMVMLFGVGGGCRMFSFLMIMMLG